MGWIFDGAPDAEHEGYPIGVLAGGVIPTYASGGQWFEMEFRDGWWSPGGAATDPGTEPAWLQPTCACGWRGERVAYDARAEGVVRAQWDAHMDEITVHQLAVAKAGEALVDALVAARKGGEFDDRSLAVIRALRATQDHIDTQIGMAVGAARARDLTWDVIGEALGVTPHAARGRFHDTDAVPAHLGA